MREKRRIRRRHRVGSQVLRTHPFQRLAVERLNEALPAPADVKRHQEVEVGIGVAREGQRSEAVRLDRDSEFLAEFPDERVLRPFVGVNLPAGELPQALKRLAFGPLRQQHASVGVDQRRRDDEHKPHDEARTRVSAQPPASS